MTGGDRELHGTIGAHPLALIVGILRRPSATFTVVAGDARLRRQGYGAVVLLAVAYTVAIALLAWGDADPVPDPFLRIPADSYYSWAVLFTGPVLLAGWVLTAGVMQLWAAALGGTGRFEDLAAVTGLITAVASLATLVPDLVMGVLGVYGGGWTTTVWGRMLTTSWIALYVAMFLVLFPLAVRAVHRLERRPAIVVGAVSFVLYQGFLLVFIR